MVNTLPKNGARRNGAKFPCLALLKNYGVQYDPRFVFG